ncbi:putative 2-dehydropantoate 2-reductase [Porphyridium purpureum]|uniref:Putative 2-dehydropantoate 2-reductase n=1 Tax=Porphyridium purpureum TaxID=35688 RepID=A0A5J4Z488_PORPP|nr:putative 2-dehydropantoate 2-reductase [Porphyridium purpureum]|eukprot:POR7362..scf295_1
MRVCVVGAGAIGALLGVKIWHAAGGEHAVTMVGRAGSHLSAMQRDGLRLCGESVADDVSASGDNGGEICMRTGERNAAFFSSLEDVPQKQDVVFLALKENQLAQIMPGLPSVSHAETVYVTLQNGIPWWYFQIYSGPNEYANKVVESVDPQGVLFHGIDPCRVLGCVVYPAARKKEPGVVEHVEGIRFPLGELDGSHSERAERISQLLVTAGFKAPVVEDIRSELWLKLWGSLAFNPISALCHATLGELCTFPPSRELAVRMMREAEQVGIALGASFRVPLERRLDGAASVGAHKTSMCADVEAGRPMEVDAIMASVVELGALTGVFMPSVSAVYALLQLLNRQLDQGVSFPAVPAPLPDPKM